MGADRIRYLTVRPSQKGGLPRYFWSPSPELRAEGWRTTRVPQDHHRYTDADSLAAAARAAALQLNTDLDQARVKAALTASAPQAPARRTLGELLKEYRADEAFTRLAPKTRAGYLQCIRRLEDWGHDLPVLLIKPSHVQTLKNSLKATPAYAAAIIRVLRLVLAWGENHDWLPKGSNPASEPDLPELLTGGMIWPRAAVKAFVETADAEGRHSVGTAVLLNEWLGQRLGDVLRLPRKLQGQGSWLIRQRKTGAGVMLPVHLVPHLAERIEAELARIVAREATAPKEAPRAATLIVSEETGQPYSEDNFRHVFARIRAKAARATPTFETDFLLPGRDANAPDAFLVRMEELTFMDLRHTAITRMSEADIDTAGIATISGHAEASVLQIMQRYRVHTGKLATMAFEKRRDAEAPPAPATDGKEGKA